MIIATLEQLQMYRFGEGWRNALHWLEHQDLNASVSGFDIRPSVYQTKSHAEGVYESHVRYVDIQLLLSGKEYIYCAPRGALRPLGDYDEAKDVRFYENAAEAVKITLVPGLFAVLFPDDGHMPNIMVKQPEEVHKLVLKIPIHVFEI